MRHKRHVMLLRLLLLSLLAGPALAVELRVCADNRNIPPLVYANGMGSAQYLLPIAAANLGMHLSISYHPQPRCMLGVEQQRFDALMTVSPNAATFSLVDFPQTGDGHYDHNRAYLNMSVVAFRMKNNPATWDGKQFSRLTKPVLYESGVPAVNLTMQKLAAPSKASARTPVHMIQMMRLGRADIGIGLEPAVSYVLKTEDPEDEFEIFQPPLFSAAIYLGIGKAFHAANPELSQDLWDEIQQLKNSPEWHAIEEQVLNNQLPPTVELLNANQPREQTE